MVARPTGTVAFMFTDLVGSTRLWEREETPMTEALAQHDRIMRSVIEAHDGYVFSTAGDAFGAAFDTCMTAAEVSAELHVRLAEADWPTSAPLTIRIGLHVGSADERDGDYFGPVLNRAARIMGVAHGGQTLASSGFHDLIAGGWSGGLVDLGEHRLKDLGAPEHLWQLGEGAFAALPTLSASRHNLPVERTPLVGREAELGELALLVERERLVSVLGIGGTGKTRVAAAVAAEVVDRYAAGAWFVDLIPARTHDDVVTAIASAVGVSLAGDHLSDALASALDSKDMLIVLDNCEHVTEYVGDVIDRLLGMTSAPRFIATSREPLDLVDETIVQLAPLQTVGTDGRSSAVELFENAAQRAGRAVRRGDAAAVAEICDRLDGHPLSIELAAAQLRTLNPEQLRSRLGERFELLARRRSIGRHASLLAVLDDTWSMLDSDERMMLLQLAAFPGTFDLDGVEGVCADLDVGLVGRTLGGLVDRSLVAIAADDRFRMLESVKEFCRRRWNDDEALIRHEQWILAWFAALDREDGLVDLGVQSWIGANWDDWRQVEDRLRADSRRDELCSMLMGSLVSFHGAFLGPDALAIGRRLRGDLKSGGLEPVHQASIGLALATLGLPARRPEWISEHSAVAVDLFRAGAADDHVLSYALVMASWMTALRDVDAGLTLLDEAFELAERVGAGRIADVALGYRANHLALAGREAAAQDVLDRLEQRLGPDDDSIGHGIWLFVKMASCLVRDPAASVAAAEALAARPFQQPWGLIAASHGAAGGVDAALEYWDRMLAMVDRWFVDDGLPDLLIPPAALAFGLGDHERCRTLITAVRCFERPTQDFLTTIMYRQLRGAVGLSDADPLVTVTAEELLVESDAWMRSTAANAIRSASG